MVVVAHQGSDGIGAPDPDADARVGRGNQWVRALGGASQPRGWASRLATALASLVAWLLVVAALVLPSIAIVLMIWHGVHKVRVGMLVAGVLSGALYALMLRGALRARAKARLSDAGLSDAGLSERQTLH